MGTSSGDTTACLRDNSSTGSHPNPRRSYVSHRAWVIWQLVPLRVTFFFFFGGLGCLLVFLPLHMREVGLTQENAIIVSVVAPLVSMLGPLVAGPAADRLGRHKMFLTACLLLSAVFYSLLLAIPVTTTQETPFHQDSLLTRPPAVRLRCDPQGATIVQERCAPLCPSWPSDQAWELEVSNCRTDCVEEDENPSMAAVSNTDQPTSGVGSGSEAPPDDSTDDSGLVEVPSVPDSDAYDSYDYPSDSTDEETEKTSNTSQQIFPLTGSLTSQPYLCFNNETNEKGGSMCHVFTNNTRGLLLNTSLPEVATLLTECHYPLSRVRIELGNRSFSSLHCRTPCKVYCQLQGKLWETSADGQQQCPAPLSDMNPTLTFWSYLLVRSMADIFPAAAMPLIGTLVLGMSRDHRSDVGRDLAWGAVGAGVLVPGVCAFIMAGLHPWPETPSALPILAFAIFSLLAVLSLAWTRLQSDWYTRTSRRMEFGAKPSPRIINPREVIALFVVLTILGIFWGALDTYLPWFLTDNGNSTATLGITLALGTCLALPFLWSAEHLVDYCGHVNLFIMAFAFYIIRFTGLGFMDTTILGVAFEVFEVFTLCLMWVSAVLYARHLFSRHLTTTGQALIVFAHFCLGRFLGAAFGGVILAYADPWKLYRVCSLASALLGWLYFCLYHCCLKPRCGRQPSTVRDATDVPVDGVTTNGSYTPLRVYNGNQNKQELRY